MASSRSNSVSEEEITLMDASPSNPATPPTEKFSSDEDEIIQENKFTGYHPIGTENEEKPLLQAANEQEIPSIDTLINNLNRKNYQDSVQYLQDLNITRNNFYDYAQKLINKIGCHKNNESLSSDKQPHLIFAESMAYEVYLMQYDFHDNNDTKLAPVLIGLNCALNAIEQPLDEENITKLGDLYNDIKNKPELGSSSIGLKIAGGALILLGIIAMAACITLAVASAGILTPAALTGMGFVGGIIAAGVSMLGSTATATLGAGIATGALSTTIGIGCTISGSEQGFASSTHSLFNCTSAMRNKLNPEGFSWKSNIYPIDPKETKAEAKETKAEAMAMALS